MGWTAGGDVDGECRRAAGERNAGRHLAKGAERGSAASQPNRARETRAGSELKLVLSKLTSRNGRGVELPGAGPEENAATAVPLRDRPCGEPRASSENIRVAVRWPGAMGVKTTEKVQFADDASMAAQSLVKLKSEGFGPERETEHRQSRAGC